MGLSGVVPRIVSGAKKKAFDRGGPVWPPQSNAADDRLGRGGVWGAAPPSQNRKIFEKFSTKFEKFPSTPPVAKPPFALRGDKVK